MDDTLTQSLLNWVNTFPVSSTANTVHDLDDGIVLFEVLSQITPHICANVVIKREVNDNYLLKVGNLKKVTGCLTDFFTHELGVHDTALELINLTTIAKGEYIVGGGGERDMVQLMELVLGAAVECENKNHFIENIMLMDETSQQDLMVVIERVIRRHQQGGGPASPQVGRGGVGGVGGGGDYNLDGDWEMELIRLRKERDEAHTSFHQLSLEHVAMGSEVAQLKQDKEQLVETIKALENQVEEKEQLIEFEKKRGKENKAEDSLLINMAKQSREMNEQHTEALQLELEEKEREISELKKKIEEQAKAAQELRKLRDKLDIMEEKVAAASKTEEKFARLQGKLEEVADLKQQYKNMQDQRESYMKKSLQLEEEVARIPFFKSQIEELKQTNHVLKTQALGATPELQMKIQKLEDDNKQLREENDLRQDKISDMDETIQRLKSDLESSSMSGESLGDLGVTAEPLSSFTEVLTPEIKEKMMRLELENEKLKQQAQSQAHVSDSNSADAELAASLQNRLDDALRQNASYEEQLASQQRQFEEDKLRFAEQQTSALAQVHASKLAELEQVQQRQLEELHSAAERAKAEALEATQKAAEAAAVSTNVVKQETVSAEDEQRPELVSDEDIMRKMKMLEERNEYLTTEKSRLEGYLRTAKTMIRELRQKPPPDQVRLRFFSLFISSCFLPPLRVCVSLTN
eukprot:TRINITY_DN2647_c0_g1_i5.p1 TRINITY_DN2647_c0_g1~~TRINITY_DN2647_c0_g1_i5.p1  ORF type:complete len:694 (-),score=189.13 TRINITY_DN2647_c0_g1_i5:311-2392(-)